MKRLEQQMRESMREVTEPVNKEHVAGFAAYLKAKRRRRTSVLIALLAGVVVLGSAAAYMLSVSTVRDVHNKPGEVLQEQAMSEGTTESHLKEAGEEEIDEKPSAVLSDSRGPTQGDGKIVARNDKILTMDERRSEELQERAKSGAGVDIGEAKRVDSGNVTDKSKPTGRTTSVSGVHEDAIDSAAPDPRLSEGNEESQIVLSPAYDRDKFDVVKLGRRSVDLESSDSPVITITLHKLSSGKINFGVVGGWFTTAADLSAGAENGRGMRIGGYLNYRIAPRVVLGLEGGWQYTNRGYSFDKQSVSTQYGFAQRSESNTLKIHQTYAWFATFSARYQPGRHGFEAGMHLYHVYGARGDVLRRTLEGNQPTGTTELSDVWVSTNGLALLSAELTMGYRYTVNHQLEAGLRMHKPITNIGSRQADTRYAYRTNAYRFAVQAGLYYRLNR